VEAKGEESDEDEAEAEAEALSSALTPSWPCSWALGSSKMADEQETKADEKRPR
jgi:hypothetical protein